MAIHGSKEGQDQLVLHLIPKPGFYLDVGANHPIIGSNSWRLREEGWQGLSFDKSSPEESLPNYFVCDVTSVDMGMMIGAHSRVDYISFDVDSATMPALKNFPFEEYPFSIMTFEHDLYRRGGDLKKQACIERLAHDNYAILMENVRVQDKPFEDWWINLNHFVPEILAHRMSDVSWQEAIQAIKASDAGAYWKAP